MAYVQHILSPSYRLIPFAFSAYTVYIYIKYVVFYIGYILLLIFYTYGEEDACVFFHLNAEIMVSSPHFRELSVHKFSSDRKFSIRVKGWIMSGNQ